MTAKEKLEHAKLIKQALKSAEGYLRMHDWEGVYNWATLASSQAKAIMKAEEKGDKNA
jgi:hypothetical protein